MVSNWCSSISRRRCGNSIVTTPSGFRIRRSPSTKSWAFGTWASTLLPTIRSAVRPCSSSSRASRSPKKSTTVSIPRSFAAAATLAAGSIPSVRHPSGLEELEQVAVVAGDLDDLARAVEFETLGDQLDVASRVLDPGIGVGREVGVVTEDLPGRREHRQLHQQAFLTDADVEGVEPLALVQL